MVDGRGLRAVKTRQIESVLRVARGMDGGRVERVETVIFVFDLRSIGDDEPDLAKAAHDGVGDLRERMQLAERVAASRQGEVGRLLWQCGFKFEFVAARSERGFEFGLGDRKSVV